MVFIIISAIRLYERRLVKQKHTLYWYSPWELPNKESLISSSAEHLESKCSMMSFPSKHYRDMNRFRCTNIMRFVSWGDIVVTRRRKFIRGRSAVPTVHQSDIEIRQCYINYGLKTSCPYMLWSKTDFEHCYLLCVVVDHNILEPIRRQFCTYPVLRHCCSCWYDFFLFWMF